jgi:hypothetical protein
MDEYFIDLTAFSIDKLRNLLKSKEILPGRILLKAQIDDRFDLLKTHGIESLADLLDELKNKKKIEQFAQKTDLDVDYLILLRREANSYVSVPEKLSNMPFVETEIIETLESSGIMNSRDLFDLAAKQSDREKLAIRLKIPPESYWSWSSFVT